jgi:hypothetical protein
VAKRLSKSVRTFGPLLLLLTAAAPAAWALQMPRCRLDGPTILVQHERSLFAPDPVGDPGGQVDPWKIVGGGTHVQSSAVQSLPVDPAWRVGATADFNDDGVCDLAWTRPHPEGDGPIGVALVIAITNASVEPPVLTPPDTAPYELLGPGWVVVGSGDFVGPGYPGTELVGAPDGRPDLVLWNGTTGLVAFWASDGTGHFPAARRYGLYGGGFYGKRPVAVANIDGQGLPEIIWEDQFSGSLSYWQLAVHSYQGIILQGQGPLLPLRPRTGNWILRGADDFDADGMDDLLFQEAQTESGEVWKMDGPSRKAVVLLSPAHLPPNVPPGADGPWVIVGPR